jgi:hypothetical protein
MRPKVSCEICGLNKKHILHRHHIIPRMDPRSTNSTSNLAILCPNCHSIVHSGEIIIIGLYDTTDGLQLMWFKRGDELPIPKEFWKVKNNPLVTTIGGAEDDCPDKEM